VPLVGHLVGHDQVVLGVSTAVCTLSPTTPVPRWYGPRLRIGQRGLLVGAARLPPLNGQGAIASPAFKERR
jgi:hypothetical protein